MFALRVWLKGNGRLWLSEEGLYEISLTRAGPNDADPWRLLSLDVRVGPTDAGAHTHVYMYA